jgi:helix-hairpin-helix protein
MSALLNRMIAGRLEEAAEMLSQDGAEPVSVQAYRLAASSVRHWPISMAVMFKHRGLEGLEEVPGVGPRIARVIREVLTHHRLPSRARLHEHEGARPSVEELLDVDREYRAKAPATPVLQTRRGPRRYTALYSNTERAHRFGRTHDWVLLYVREGDDEYQYTVITATRGLMRGHRIVAGHERSCRSAERDAA